MEVNELTGIVLDACIKIRKWLYQKTLYYELTKRNLYVERQLLMPIYYEELVIKDAYRIDLLLENKVVIEIKSVERVAPVHFKQVMTYLKMSNLKNAILLNFNVEWMKEALHRIFNNDGS